MAFVFNPLDGSIKPFRDETGKVVVVLKGKKNTRRRKGRSRSSDTRNVVVVLTPEEWAASDSLTPTPKTV